MRINHVKNVLRALVSFNQGKQEKEKKKQKNYMSVLLITYCTFKIAQWKSFYVKVGSVITVELQGCMGMRNRAIKHNS